MNYESSDHQLRVIGRLVADRIDKEFGLPLPPAMNHTHEHYSVAEIVKRLMEHYDSVIDDLCNK